MIDDLALAAARQADLLLASARSRGNDRWAHYLEHIPDLLRDGTLNELRAVSRRARAAYGPKDSIREALPADLTEPFLEALDRMIKALARDALSN